MCSLSKVGDAARLVVGKKTSAEDASVMSDPCRTDAKVNSDGVCRRRCLQTAHRGALDHIPSGVAWVSACKEIFCLTASSLHVCCVIMFLTVLS